MYGYRQAVAEVEPLVYRATKLATDIKEQVKAMDP